MNAKKVCLFSSAAWVAVIICAALYCHTDIVSTYMMKDGTKLEALIHHPLLSQAHVTSTTTQDALHYCKPPSVITTGSEGKMCKDYKLESVNVIVRHGDRSSLYKVQNFNNVSCHSNSSDGIHKSLLSSFKLFVNDPVFKQGLGQRVKIFSNPGFLSSPFSPTCQTGKLTEIGLLQGLLLGHKLAKAYRVLDAHLLTPAKYNKVLVFSTLHQRTLFTSLALLYGMAPQFNTKYVDYIPVTNPFFCFKLCHCPLLASLNRGVKMTARRFLEDHQEVVSTVKALSGVMTPPNSPFTLSSPQDIRDASLLYMCHNSHFPCSKSNCAKKEEVNRVLRYTELELKVTKDFQASLLSSYGLLTQIVKSMGQALKKKGHKLVIYSGHDLTLTAILKSLNIFSSYPTYMSRLIFELYSDKDEQGYFRLLYEGRDCTPQLQFCKGSLQFVNQSVSSNLQQVWLCPFSNLSSFVTHCFEQFGAKNFKMACGG